MAGRWRQPPQGPDEQRYPARKWIVATVVLLVAVVGLGAHALTCAPAPTTRRADRAPATAARGAQGVTGDVQDASAIGGAFDASSVSEGVSQAMSEIEELNASCKDALGAGG